MLALKYASFIASLYISSESLYLHINCSFWISRLQFQPFSVAGLHPRALPSFGARLATQWKVSSKCGKYACYEINLHKSNIAINEKVVYWQTFHRGRQQKARQTRMGQGVRTASVELVQARWCGVNRNIVFNSESLRQFIYGRWQWRSQSPCSGIFQFPILTFEKIFLRCQLNCPFHSISRHSPIKLFLFIWSAIHMTRHIFDSVFSLGKSMRRGNRKIYSFEIVFNPLCFSFCKSHFCIINNRFETWDFERREKNIFNFISQLQLLLKCFLLIAELKRHDLMKVSVVGNWIVKWWFSDCCSIQEV